MILSCPESVERAKYHRHAGVALHETANHQWAAVCYFYSAYHLVRAALAADSIFDDWDVLRAIDQRLIPEDRFATKHQMRRGSERDFGVNDLVEVLYPEVKMQYAELHGASIGVRYKNGINIPLDDLLADLKEIEAHLGALDRIPQLRTELERSQA